MTTPELSSDTPIERLPLWLIRHICRPENHRVVGKKPEHFNYSSAYQKTYNPPDRRLPAHYRGATSNIGATPISDAQVAHLDQNDYRLWAEVRKMAPGSIHRILMVRCRWCQAVYPLREFENGIRELHKKSCHFTYNLREIFAKVVARGQCAACGQHTRIQRWGIPLCNEACQRSWMFAIDHSDIIAKAIIACRLEGRIKEVNIATFEG